MRAVDSPSAATSARVLVVDDSPTIRKVVSAILTRHGYEAVQAHDGEHALSVLAGSDRFDLALVDFVMPKMTGFEFCKRVRDDDGLRELPVILMSTKADENSQAVRPANGCARRHHQALRCARVGRDGRGNTRQDPARSAHA